MDEIPLFYLLLSNMKSTIKSIYEIRPVSTKRGEKYKFHLELEDGTKWRSSLCKSRTALTVGQEIDYTISDDEYKNIVLASERRHFSSARSTDREKQKIITALELGVQINTKSWLKGKTEDAMASADLFLNWFNDKWL